MATAPVRADRPIDAFNPLPVVGAKGPSDNPVIPPDRMVTTPVAEIPAATDGTSPSSGGQEDARPPGALLKSPRFRDFRAPPTFRGTNAKPRLVTKAARRFRTRLRYGAKSKPNYAGIHALVLWGCGTECLDGAAVNAVTGRVVFLPDSFSLCFRARLRSRLLMLADFGGLPGLSETDTYHFYDFDGRAFRLVTTINGRPEDRERLCGEGVPAFPSVHGY